MGEIALIGLPDREWSISDNEVLLRVPIAVLAKQ